MKHLFQGPLFEAIGSPVTGGAAPVAPAPAAPPVVTTTAAEATVQGEQSAWAQIALEAGAIQPAAAPEPVAPTGTAPAPTEAAAPVVETPPEPAKKELPDIANWKPATAQERYLQSQALREQRAQEQTLKSQYEQHIAQLQQERDAATAGLNRYKTLRSEGKIDEALQALDPSENVERLTKDHLAAKAKFGKEDPLTRQLKQELDQLKAEKAQEQAARQQAQDEYNARAQRAEYINMVKSEMVAATDYQTIPTLAAAPGVAEFVFQSIQSNPKQPIEWHYAVADQQFRAIFDALAPVYGGPQQKPPAPQAVSSDPTPVTSVGNPAQPGAAVVRPGGNPPPAVLPQSAAADARGTTTFTGNDDADWNALQSMFRQQPTG